METERIFMIMTVVAGVFVLLLIATAIRAALRRDEGEIGGWELRGAWVRTFAVARTAIADGVRMKLPMLFVIVMLVSIPWLAISAVGDGTVKGHVQMFLGWVFGITSFVLALITIVLASRSLSSEIAGRQIYGLVTKPIPRWQVIAGKWLGVMMLNAVLIGLSAVGAWLGVNYILSRYLSELHTQLVAKGGLTDEQADRCLDAINNVRGPGGEGVASPIIPAMADALGWSDRQVADLLIATPEQMRDNLRRLDELRRQVLTARASLRYTPPDVSERVEKRLRELKDSGEYPARFVGREDYVRREFMREYQEQERSVPFRGFREWEFQGPPPAQDEKFLMSVRCKIEGYTAPAVMSDGTSLPEETWLGAFTVGDPDSPSAYFWPDRPLPKKLNATVEFEVPTRAMAADGKIQVRFDNVDPRRFTMVFAKNTPEVLYRVGSFEGNLVRGAVMLLLPLMMIAAIAVFFSTFCTFPVAVLVTIVLVLIGMCRGFGLEAIGVTEDYLSLEPSRSEVSRKAMAEVVLGVLELGNADVSDRLVGGRMISWSDIASEALRIGTLGTDQTWSRLSGTEKVIHVLHPGVLVRAAGFLLLGVFVFRRRELAAVIV